MTTISNTFQTYTISMINRFKASIIRILNKKAVNLRKNRYLLNNISVEL